MSNKLTQARLKELLHYDPGTGVFTWRIAFCRKVRVGAQAGSVRPDGYVHIGVLGQRLLAHRLAVLYMTGTLPTCGVDHLDGLRWNNVWGNLRVCTDAENGQNRGGPNRNNTSGYLGVSEDRRYGTFSAKIMQGRRSVHLGSFETAEDAHQAYLQAKSRLHTFQPTPRNL